MTFVAESDFGVMCIYPVSPSVESRDGVAGAKVRSKRSVALASVVLVSATALLLSLRLNGLIALEVSRNTILLALEGTMGFARGCGRE